MEETVINGEMWLAGETFMQDTMSLIIIGIGIALFAIVFMLLYSYKNRRTWIVAGIVITLCVGVGIFTTFKVKQYATYEKLSANVSPRIRDRQKQPFIYHYNKQEPPLLRDIEKLDALPFYEREAIVDQEYVTYLGKTDHVYYFRLGPVLYSININSEQISVSDEISQTEYLGYTYRLKDSSFSEIGFFEEVGPIYYGIVIPKAEENKVYEELDEVSEVLIF